ELSMKLSPDKSLISWETLNCTTKEYGEIDLAGNIKTVKSTGRQGLQYIDKDGKVAFEVQAQDTPTRDQWIVSLNELLSSWEERPSERPTSKLSAKGTSNKAEYFKNREDEIKKRAEEAQKKKEKYSAGGMKYTALAMANRA
ncbi:unnamed protein product, partial [Symbiodinium microadriaticum]